MLAPGRGSGNCHWTDATRTTAGLMPLQVPAKKQKLIPPWLCWQKDQLFFQRSHPLSRYDLEVENRYMSVAENQFVIMLTNGSLTSAQIIM
jgi:hypothetical protein